MTDRTSPAQNAARLFGALGVELTPQSADQVMHHITELAELLDGQILVGRNDGLTIYCFRKERKIQAWITDLDNPTDERWPPPGRTVSIDYFLAGEDEP